jgi:two-component system sensor histidine kinase DesK
MNISLDAATESELAAVLREAVTNILRHSTARDCRIELACQNGQLSLVVDNDGAASSGQTAQGRGLANIAARTARLGGWMSTQADGGRFLLAARVPAGPGVRA